MVESQLSLGGERMGVLEALRKSAGGTDLYECRHCGKKLTTNVEECPNCNRQEVAHYEFR